MICCLYYTTNHFLSQAFHQRIFLNDNLLSPYVDKFGYILLLVSIILFLFILFDNFLLHLFKFFSFIRHYDCQVCLFKKMVTLYIFTYHTKHIFELDTFFTHPLCGKILWIMWISWCITFEMYYFESFKCGYLSTSFYLQFLQYPFITIFRKIFVHCAQLDESQYGILNFFIFFIFSILRQLSEINPRLMSYNHSLSCHNALNCYCSSNFCSFSTR